MEAHRLLTLPANDKQEPVVQRSEAERATELERMQRHPCAGRCCGLAVPAPPTASRYSEYRNARR